MSTPAATISIRHHSVDELLEFLRARTMGLEVQNGPISFGGLFIEAQEMSEELAFTKLYLEENKIHENSQLAGYNIDLFSLNVDIDIYRNFGSIFYANTHIIAEIICIELTTHFATQASIIIQENYEYCLYDTGNLLIRFPPNKYSAETTTLRTDL